MRLVLALAAFAAISAVPAQAADMPVKALPGALVSYTGSQFYFMLGTAVETDKATVAGINGTAFNGYAAGGKILAGVGYIRAIGLTQWYAVEAWAAFQNIGTTSGGAQVVPGSVSAKSASFTERFMLGGDWITGFLGQAGASIPNLGLPALPSLPIGAAGAHPYLFAALHEDQIGADYMLDDAKVWRVTAGAGVGIQFQLTPTTPGAVPVTADVFTEYKFSSQGLTIGNPTGSIAGANLGAGVVAGLIIKH